MCTILFYNFSLIAKEILQCKDKHDNRLVPSADQTLVALKFPYLTPGVSDGVL